MSIVHTFENKIRELDDSSNDYSWPADGVRRMLLLSCRCYHRHRPNASSSPLAIDPNDDAYFAFLFLLLDYYLSYLLHNRRVETKRRHRRATIVRFLFLF
jgi:hypothetical protein